MGVSSIRERRGMGAGAAAVLAPLVVAAGPVGVAGLLGVSGTFGAAGLAAQEIVTCAGQTDQTLSGLAGLVRDAEGGFPIPGAAVEASWDAPDGTRASASTEADAAGAYVLCGLPVLRPIEIRASLAAFETAPLTVRLEPGPPAGWDFELEVEEGVVRGDAAFPGRVVGRLRDRESGRPVAGASVALAGEGREGLTDATGRYSFDRLTPGVYRIAVEHLAYEPMEQVIDVPGNRTLEVNFEMSADPIELEPIVITAIREKRLEVNGFYERRELSEAVGNGYFMDAEEIRRLATTKVTSVLGHVPGVRIECGGSPRAGGCRVRMTGGQPSLRSRAEVGCMNANVYVDGVRVLRDNQTMPMGIDELVLPSEIAGMEVYRGPSEVPAEFGGSVGRCGAIVIWTGSGGS